MLSLAGVFLLISFVSAQPGGDQDHGNGNRPPSHFGPPPPPPPPFIQNLSECSFLKNGPPKFLFDLQSLNITTQQKFLETKFNPNETKAWINSSLLSLVAGLPSNFSMDYYNLEQNISKCKAAAAAKIRSQLNSSEAQNLFDNITGIANDQSLTYKQTCIGIVTALQNASSDVRNQLLSAGGGSGMPPRPNQNNSSSNSSDSKPPELSPEGLCNCSASYLGGLPIGPHGYGDGPGGPGGPGPHGGPPDFERMGKDFANQSKDFLDKAGTYLGSMNGSELEKLGDKFKNGTDNFFNKSSEFFKNGSQGLGQRFGDLINKTVNGTKDFFRGFSGNNQGGPQGGPLGGPPQDFGQGMNFEFGQQNDGGGAP